MTTLACLSVTGCRVPLPVLECVSLPHDELHRALLDLRERSGAEQLFALSTCERTELYAFWRGPADPRALVQALADHRRLEPELLEEATDLLCGQDATRHLLRVAAGLESFVLGETDIVGQVRSAAEASRTAGLCGLELERLLAAAIHSSRRVHRSTRLREGGRSVASAAVHKAAVTSGGDLSGQRVLVVGAGQVATEVATTATRLGADVTVCNRTRRHAEKLAAAGATVVDLSALDDVLAHTDLAIFGTAAPHRLLDATQLAQARPHPARDLLIVDLCVPRNVDPAVRGMAGVRLVDLDDLRLEGTSESEVVTSDVARADQIVEMEVDRYLRWQVSRSAASALSRLRADVEACAADQARRASAGVPDHLRPVIENQVHRAIRQLAHAPTKRLLEAAEAGDDRLVEALAGLFASPSQTVSPPAALTAGSLNTIVSRKAWSAP